MLQRGTQTESEPQDGKVDSVSGTGSAASCIDFRRTMAQSFEGRACVCMLTHVDHAEAEAKVLRRTNAPGARPSPSAGGAKVRVAAELLPGDAVHALPGLCALRRPGPGAPRRILLSDSFGFLRILCSDFSEDSVRPDSGRKGQEGQDLWLS